MTYIATIQQKFKPKVSVKILTASLTLVILIAFGVTPTAHWLEENTSLSWLFLLRGEIPPPTDMVLITLNSASAERMGLSRFTHAWPRTLYANLLEQLLKTKTELVVFDIAFKAATEESQDAAFERALEQSPNVILYKYLKRHQIQNLGGAIDIEEEIPPLDRFAQWALASGFFILAKTNSTITSAPLFYELPSGVAAAQPVLAYLALQPVPQQNNLWQALTNEPLDLKQPIAERAKKLRALALATNAATLPQQSKPLFSVFSLRAPLTINFYGPAQTLNHIDIDHVLNMSTKELNQWFANKVVYVGYLESWQTEQLDAYKTVYTNANGVDISGVELSATVLANLRNNQWIKTLPWIWQAVFTAAIFILGLALYQLRPALNAAAQLGILITLFTLACVTFSVLYLWLPISVLLIALTSANGLQLVSFYHSNRKRLKEIRYALSQYLPADAATALSGNINAMEKQHKLVHGVVLMTDVKGFTSLSESLEPDALHRLMNRYYQALIHCVKEQNGFIGNIVGDSLMALWTGPEITLDMCLRALTCAEHMQRSVADDEEFNRLLPTCIALHGGQFSLGNLGAKGHFEYSPVGDIINTTSRIEHFNRDLGTQLLLSKVVAAKLNEQEKSTPPLRYLGLFNMRNKSAATALFTYPLKDPVENSRFAKAVDLFQNHHYQQAHTQFLQLTHQPIDGPSQYYIKACAQQLTPINRKQ